MPFRNDISFIRMQVLDDLGDRSEPEIRERYFNEIDKDGSGAIDFEEFLGVRLIWHNRSTKQNISKELRKTLLPTSLKALHAPLVNFPTLP